MFLGKKEGAFHILAGESLNFPGLRGQAGIQLLTFKSADLYSCQAFPAGTLAHTHI